MGTQRIFGTPKESDAFKRGFNEGYDYRSNEISSTGLDQGLKFATTGLWRGFAAGIAVGCVSTFLMFSLYRLISLYLNL